MFKSRTMNAISPHGIEALEKRGCAVGEDLDAPDALLVRSAELHGASFPPSLLAIGRAGAGTNNIPVADCTERGVVVFNAPGDAHRDTLCIAVGNGCFERVYLIRHGYQTPPRYWRFSEWCYPYAFEDTETNALYVVYAQNKEDCELAVIPLESLR